MPEPVASPAVSFGRFELHQELGRGAMGVVHVAVQSDLGRRVALKLLPRERLADAALIAAFRDEAQAAARVRHPGLVEIFDAGVHDGQPYLAMELVEGQDLEAVVANGALPARRAARLIAEIARAVAALHEHGIVHRDLKPSNVLIDRQGHARVTDFGLALVKGRHGVADRESIVGTPGCMAPEQIDASRGEVGPRSDVWAIGALLFRLLTGRGPHHSDNPVAMILSTVGRAAPRIREVRADAPLELDAIAANCLARRPERRYESAGHVADDLERFLRAESVSVRLPGWWRRLANTARRHALLAAHLLAVGLLWCVAAVDYFVLEYTGAAFFWPTTALALAVAVGSAVFDRASRRVPKRMWPINAWILIDVLACGAIASLGDGPSSAMVYAFPLVVTASGLWGSERVVAWATVVTIVVFGLLAARAEVADSPFQKPVDVYLILTATLLVTGVVVMRIVRQLRLTNELVAGGWRQR